MNSKPRNDASEFGELGVRLTIEKLIELGFDCEIMPDNQEDYDITANPNGWPTFVEVKTAKPHYDRASRKYRYMFNIRNQLFDYVVCICVTPESKHYFVIPYTEVESQKNITITSKDPTKYKGWAAKYLEHWSVLA